MTMQTQTRVKMKNEVSTSSESVVAPEIPALLLLLNVVRLSTALPLPISFFIRPTSSTLDSSRSSYYSHVSSRSSYYSHVSRRFFRPYSELDYNGGSAHRATRCKRFFTRSCAGVMSWYRRPAGAESIVPPFPAWGQERTSRPGSSPLPRRHVRAFPTTPATGRTQSPPTSRSFRGHSRRYRGGGGGASHTPRGRARRIETPAPIHSAQTERGAAGVSVCRSAREIGGKGARGAVRGVLRQDGMGSQ